MVEKLSREAGRSQESPRRGEEPLPEGREGSGGPPVGPGEVESPSRRDDRGRESPQETWRIGMPSRRAGRGREALAKSQEGLGGIGSPPRGSGGLEALQEGWEGQEFLPECQKGLGVPPGGLARVGRPFWRAGRVGQDWEALPEGWDRSGGPPIWL